MGKPVVVADRGIMPELVEHGLSGFVVRDTPETLAERVLREEHRIYPQAIRWFCDGHLSLDAEGRVLLKRMEQPGSTLVAPGLE